MATLVQQPLYAGRSLVMEPETIICPWCRGRGWLVISIIERDGSEWDVTYDCPRCNGHGRLLRDGSALRGAMK
jgi:DnaJ-class molecular chaperone